MLTHALTRDALVNAPVCPDGQLDGDERGGLGRESKRLVRLADVVVGREAEDELGVGRTRLMCRVQEGVQGKECCAEDVIGGEDLRALVGLRFKWKCSTCDETERLWWCGGPMQRSEACSRRGNRRGIATQRNGES